MRRVAKITTAAVEVTSSTVGAAVGAQFAGKNISGLAVDLTAAATDKTASTVNAKTAGGVDGKVSPCTAVPPKLSHLKLDCGPSQV